MTVRRVVLFNPRSSADRKPVLPMSLLSLGAVLEGRWPYVIVDGNLVEDAGGALARAVGDDPGETVLGVTVMPGPQLSQAVPVCRDLKSRFPRLTIVWGGYFPSQHWQSCLADRAVDFVVRGHGELVFADLLAALDAGDPDLATIHGLAYADDTGEPRSNAGARIPSPADLPDWNLDRVDLPRYARQTFLGDRTVGYNSSYGCPFFCNFCAVVNMVQGAWLAQPAARVALALAAYRDRAGIDAVEFVDNNFFVHQERVAEVSDRIRGLGMRWWGEGRVDTMLAFSDRTWRAMAEAGLAMVFLGAESGSAETLARMHKGGRLTPEMTLDLVGRMRAHGIVPELSFVLGSPPDPDEDAARTMELIRRVKRINPATEIILYLYTPVPLEGNLLHDASRSGFAFPQSLDEWVSPEWLEFSQRRQRLPWTRRSLQRRLREFERVLNAYYPTTTMRGLGPIHRGILRAASALRYHTRIYDFPLELELLHRLVRYQRPETSGF